MHWRGLLEFRRYTSEERLETILRAFTLPQHTKEDPEWGDEGREFYEDRKCDKFQEARKFTGTMRVQFQNAMKPGGGSALASPCSRGSVERSKCLDGRLQNANRIPRVRSWVCSWTSSFRTAPSPWDTSSSLNARIAAARGSCDLLNTGTS